MLACIWCMDESVSNAFFPLISHRESLLQKRILHFGGSYYPFVNMHKNSPQKFWLWGSLLPARSWGRIMCKCFGSISRLENRPMIGWPSKSTNQRPGFQLTYVSNWLMLPKHLHMIRPILCCFLLAQIDLIVIFGKMLGQIIW